MIDITWIRNNPEEIEKGLKRRGSDPSVVKKFLEVDKEWKELLHTVETLRKKQKELTQEQKREEAKENKEQIKQYNEKLSKIKEAREAILLSIPNIPFEDVLEGEDETENISRETVGEKPSFSFKPKDHIQLGEALNIVDLEVAGEVSGARFYYLKGDGALLSFALLQFAINHLTKKGFIPIIPPVMIRPDVYRKIGRLTDDQKDERFYIEKDDLYLIGSAEHTIAPLHMNEVLDENTLPRRYVGFSTCFRREAGSYGKDTKGMFRVHQFDKVELFSFSDPGKSEEEHHYLLNVQKELYNALQIPYQVIEICTGDMGPTDARQFDIEAWIPSQNTYREVASCSNTTDYQTRGTQTKIRKGDESVYAHALNATGIALSRTILAIIENNQQEDGSIKIPQVLQPYIGKEYIK